jgi:hypothetical protein
VANASETVATMGRENIMRTANFKSQDCARDVVTRARAERGPVNIGTAENSCFKGFPRTRR